MPMIEEIVDEPAPAPAPLVSGCPDPEELYREKTQGRIDREWEDQLARAKEANGDVDQNDVDDRALYGEQSEHNYPDMHADWGDADAGLKAAAARSARAAGIFTNHMSSGWNSEYRQQLEDAMAMVADSRDVMKNLKKMRVRRDDQAEGVAEAARRTAAEDAAEWEAKRAEELEKAARRRRAATEDTAAAAAAEEKENAAGRVVGKALPDFMLRRGRGNKSAGGAASEETSSSLVAAHREWLSMLGAEEGELTDARRKSAVPLITTATEEDASGGAVCAEDLASIRRTMAAAASSVADDDLDDPALHDDAADDDDDDGDFFSLLSSARPALVSSLAPVTEKVDFWNQDMYGAGDEDDELDSFEEQMAQMLRDEITTARRGGAVRAGGAEE